MVSGFASASRRTRLAGGAALGLLAAACGKLDVEPGGDFGVRVLNATPIEVVGKVSVPLRIAVDGCETFRVAVGIAGASHAVEAVRDGDAFVLDVPVDWVRSQEGACLRGADRAISSVAHVDVTCSDAGRTASASFELSYATADVVLDAWNGRTGSAVQYLYPTDDPLLPRAVLPARGRGAGMLFSRYFDPAQGGSTYDSVPAVIDWTSYERDPLDRPRVVEGDQVLFITGGCWIPSLCTPIEVAPGVLAPSEGIWAKSLTSFHSWPVYVPAHVTDIAPLPGGELLVVSHFSSSEVTYGTFFSPRDSIVVRVALNPWPSDGSAPEPRGTVEIVGYFPDEVVKTRLSRMADGRLAFVTHQHPEQSWLGETVVLNVTDGYTIERTPDLSTGLPPGDAFWSASLSPDASLMLVAWWLGATGAHAWTRLPIDRAYWPYGDDGSAEWGTDMLVLWKGAAIGATSDQDVGHAQVFELAPPHARLFRYDVAPLPTSSAHATLHGAVPVGEHVVLTTSTGVRVLDRSGRVVGGADPLPCRMSPTAVAIASGPHHAAVGTAENVLVFDLSKL